MQSSDIMNSTAGASNPRRKKCSKCSIFSLVIGVLAASLAGLTPAWAATPRDKGSASDEIKIIGRDDGRIEEFRIAGRIYMIKITPRYGVPYYLIDSNGNGELDTRKTEVDEHLMIPSWTLLRWK